MFTYKCMIQECSNKIKDRLPRSVFYCKNHEHMDPRRPDDRIMVTLTDDQIAELRVMLDGHQTGGLVPADQMPQMAPPHGTHHNALMYGRKCSELEIKLEKAKEAFDLMGKWLSAALDDPKVCDEMKSDIQKFFEIGEKL